MDQRTEQRVRDWDSQSLAGGFGALRNLAEADFSGAVVSTGDTWLFMLNGRVVGVFQGAIEDFETADGTVYEAPDPSLPLLFTMLEQGGEQRAKYYTEDTPVSEAHETLSDAQFTGYIELSENVLSGDYYVVYYGGRSMSCAFVGSSERLLTGDEAFTQADDEVGIYEVRTVDIDVVDIPEPEEPEPTGGSSDSDPASGGASDPGAASGGEPADASAEPEPADAASEPDSGTEADPRADEPRRETDARASEPRDEGRGGGAAGEPTEASGAGQAPDRGEADRQDQPRDAGRSPEAGSQEPTETRRQEPDRAASEDRDRSGQEPERGQTPESGRQGRDAAGDPTGAAADRQQDRGRETDRREGQGREAGQRSDQGREAGQRSDQGQETGDRGDQGREGGRQQDRAGGSGTEPRQSDAGGRAEAGQPAREPEPAPEPGDQRGAETPRSAAESTTSPEPEREPEPAPDPADGAGGQRAAGQAETGDARPEPMPAEAFDETERIPSLDPDHTGTDSDEVEAEAAASSGGTDAATGTDAALSADAVAGDSGRRSPEAATGGAVRSSESSDTGAEAVDAAVSEEGEAAGELRSKLADREQRIEDLEAKLADLRVQRDGLRDERDELREEVEELESEIADLESEIESLRDRLDDGTEGRRRLSEEEALRGTNLFVRYDSKSAGTLEDAHAGEIDAEEVNENLRLEHHTQFDAEEVAVDGRPFEEFFADSIYREFVEWAVRTLLYEIRDTGNVKNLKELYDALPKLDRVELLGEVDVEYTEDGETYSENRQFDAVLRDRKGNPLLVADVNDSRSPAAQDMMEAVVENASEVKGSHETLSGAMLVTASFFEPGALETADEAAGGGGLMGGSSKASFVKLSRKQGYHLLLVEARDGEFHVNVPEL